MIVCVTGSTAVGKTTFCNKLKQLGATVISADAIGKEILTDSNVVCKLTEKFPDAVLENGVDTQKLAELAFANKESADALNQISHPLLIKELRETALALEQRLGIVIVDAALYYELELDKLCDTCVLISAPKELVKTRLKNKTLLKRVRFQRSVLKGDYKLNNNDSIDKLEKAAEKIWKELQSTQEASTQ